MIKKTISVLGLAFCFTLAAAQSSLSRYEYWIDDGFEERASQTIVPAPELNLETLADMATLAPGAHSLHFRICDASGLWSPVLSRFFLVGLTADTPELLQIAGYEYWFDLQFNTRVSSSFSPTPLVEFNQPVETGTLATGAHSLHFRFRDASGHWSPVLSRFFLVGRTADTPEMLQIAGYEYWYDLDDEHRFSHSFAPTNLVEFDQLLETAALSMGAHSLHFRFRDASGHWSPVLSRFFLAGMGASSADKLKISGLQYWFDQNDDLKVVRTFPPVDQLVLNETIDAGTLPDGMHTLHLRFCDAANRWSPVISGYFIKARIWQDQLQSRINRVRYWFNNDIGQAISLRVAPQQQFILVDSLMVGLPEGLQTISWQFGDTLGLWSSPLSSPFYHNPVLNQEIRLSAGWNLASLFVVPPNEDLLMVFAPLIESNTLRMVTDESGQTIEFPDSTGSWQNNIGMWQSTEGYKVRVNAPVTLQLKGHPVALPLSIPLSAGWNIVSFPAIAPHDALEVLQPLMDAGVLEKVMDEAGNSIENRGLYGGWVNSIGSFLPGKAYRIKVNADATWVVE